jgi:hypothetical protein
LEKPSHRDGLITHKMLSVSCSASIDLCESPEKTLIHSTLVSEWYLSVRIVLQEDSAVMMIKFIFLVPHLHLKEVAA